MTGERFALSFLRWEGYEQATLHAGPRRPERVVPPAGVDYAFDRDVWARTVTVSVSPAGRSVRVWVDGTEVLP